ncbi:hypothetical protein KSW81_005282 [Nannochloris sp. 'desiccata']|nr:hypothetical protein KSW81_005282 [Chlorella desiccata (nom. nud.)]
MTCTLVSATRLPNLQLDETCLRQARYVEHTEPGSVIITPDGQFEFVPHSHATNAVAWGSYLDGAHTVSNFGQLRVTTSGEYSDANQVFAAGWLEGFLSAPRIYENYQNLHTYFIKTLNASLEEPMAWMEEQDAWVRKQCQHKRGFQMPPGQAGGGARSGEGGDDQGDYSSSEYSEEVQIENSKYETTDAVSNHHGHHHKHRRHHHHGEGGGRGGDGSSSDFKSRFWDATCLAIRQFDGVVAGYQARASEARRTHEKRDFDDDVMGTMSYSDFLFMESNGDLYDVIDKMDPTQRPSWSPGGETEETADEDLENQAQDDDQQYKEATRPYKVSAMQAAPPPPPPPPPSAEKLFHDLALSGKCSALVKIAADLSDIYMGHSTWDSYTAMLRIYKHYAFNLTELQPAAQRMSFSSYPGEVFSDDDFFILSSKMVILQTTNKIFNDELFEKLTPHSVLSWQRIRAANWLATSGQEWSTLLEMENSGTYNNQYMIVDLTKFIPGEGPHPGLLWVAEQIPGLVVSADMTAVLSLGYWPSFNVPAFSEIYNQSGYPDFISKLEKYGQKYTKSTHWLSYESSPRASIFRRDQAGVSSLEGIKAIMRSNNWRNDPLSEGHPICAICGRGDLDTSFPEARGCYDTKVTSWRLALEMSAEAVNGPTTGSSSNSISLSQNSGLDAFSSRGSSTRGDTGGVTSRVHSFIKNVVDPSNNNVFSKALPEFNWEKAQKAVGQELLHRGQPERFNFKFERQSPGTLMEGGSGCGGGSQGEVDAAVLASV